VTEEIEKALKDGGSIWLVVKRPERKPRAKKAAPKESAPARHSKKKA
jgi:hypothetical protein